MISTTEEYVEVVKEQLLFDEEIFGAKFIDEFSVTGCSLENQIISGEWHIYTYAGHGKATIKIDYMGNIISDVEQIVKDVAENFSSHYAISLLLDDNLENERKNQLEAKEKEKIHVLIHERAKSLSLLLVEVGYGLGKAYELALESSETNLDKPIDLSFEEIVMSEIEESVS